MYKTLSEAIELVEALKISLSSVTDREVVVCPPFTALAVVKQSIRNSNIRLGAQNLYFQKEGAFTGEVSALMLKDVGVEYVIIGHSERREYFGETDEMVNKKVKAALAYNLVPIVCIGETLSQRESNKTFDVVKTQLKNALSNLSVDESRVIVIAYEPVWAIGTGRTATKQQAQEVHEFIRREYAIMYGREAADNIRILYGGSVKPENIKELMSQSDIDGALVGGASLKAEDFTKIVRY